MNRYFKGWYFKAQGKDGAAALIPAVHVDDRGKKSASLQIITEKNAWCVPFPYEEFSSHGKGLCIRLGNNVFSDKGFYLNVGTGAVEACGSLRFGPLSPLRYDIMGPFCCVPFMECRHSVFSLTHTVNGCLDINGDRLVFGGGTGYIEGDRGRSFPKAYAWTQCNFSDGSPNGLMLSVADIPIGAFHFTGIIGVVLWHGRQYRLATYLGARAAHIGNGELTVRQGRLQLTVKLLEKREKPLFAPVYGTMQRTIHENLVCPARYVFSDAGRTLFDFETDRASFEYEFQD